METRNKVLFFDLLHSGMWGRKPDLSLYDSFEPDWIYICKLANKHAVLGWIYDGINALPENIRPRKKLHLKLFSMLLNIEKSNRILNLTVQEISKIYNSANISFILLKGQGMASYYNRPNHRQPGDIDAYIGKEKYECANILLYENGAVSMHFENLKDKHRSFEFKGVTIENHLDVVRFYTSDYSKAWKIFQEEKLYAECNVVTFGDEKVYVPSPYFNSIYLLLHILQHLQTSGIGLRQVCDFMTVIRGSAADFDREMWIRDIRSLGLERAYGVMACIGNIYFGIDSSLFPFYDSKYTVLAHKVMDDILEGGNFGREWKKQRFGDGNRLKRNFHLFVWVIRRFFFIRKIYPVESFNSAAVKIVEGIRNNLNRIFKSKSLNGK